MLRGSGGQGTHGAVQIPPTRQHDTGGAWVFHALLLLWGAVGPTVVGRWRAGSGAPAALGAWSACALQLCSNYVMYVTLL